LFHRQQGLHQPSCQFLRSVDGRSWEYWVNQIFLVI
jgi:hypothetical protein